MNHNILYKTIGIVHSDFKKPGGTSIQPNNNNNIATIEVFSEYAEGLKDLDGFSHIILLYHFHLLNKTELMVTPFMDTIPHGIFATRSPARPNKIGLSVLEIKKIDKNILTVLGIDVVDGTPILDIKPYVPQFDSVNTIKIGWLRNNVHKQKDMRDDERFT